MIAPLCLSIGLPLLAFSLLGRDNPLARGLTIAMAVALLLRYLAWRWSQPLPDDGAAEHLWSALFLGVESLAALGTLLTLFFLSRHRDRSGAADAGEAAGWFRDAPVDVFICTYNESYEILERTILGATRIAHDDLRVWVLDDGARPWVRALAEELGALYVCRVKGRHAKAGNVNNGLRHALATGRRPEFVLLLDADFVPARRIIARALPLFAEPDVGIVQTPQHFFNHDPVQRNLLCARVWPDEQRLFFDVLLPAKDAWGAAFCCGTSAIFRVDALIGAGGMATETVTEDMLTTFRLAEHGWRTVYLNERLSMGLAPEGLAEYVTQRARWCLGALQQIWTRWSFLGSARLGVMHRLSFLDTVLYWCASFALRLMIFMAPLLFWWCGVVTYRATPDELVSYVAPALAGTLITVGTVSGRRIHPVLSEVYQLLCTAVVLRSVGQALTRPFGRPFKVTDKGRATDAIVVQWGLLAPFAVLAALLTAGMLLGVAGWSEVQDRDCFALVLAWSLFNLLTLAVAMTACVELPRPRRDERFAMNIEATLLGCDGKQYPCIVEDLSPRGAKLRIGGQSPLPLNLVLQIGDSEVPPLPFEPVRSGTGFLAGRLHATTAVRRALIAWLYAGRFGQEVRQANPTHAFVLSLRRVFG
ncbi:MAG: glycosyltransferase [Reyranellaceae bacterium]